MPYNHRAQSQTTCRLPRSPQRPAFERVLTIPARQPPYRRTVRRQQEGMHTDSAAPPRSARQPPAGLRSRARSSDPPKRARLLPLTMNLFQRQAAHAASTRTRRFHLQLFVPVSLAGSLCGKASPNTELEPHGTMPPRPRAEAPLVMRGSSHLVGQCEASDPDVGRPRNRPLAHAPAARTSSASTGCAPPGSAAGSGARSAKA